MATKTKTSRTKKKAKPTPAVRYLRYELQNSSNAGQETSHYIDLARDLSAINRRLYRQGRVYHVRKITIISSDTSNGDNRISFSTVPDSWVARNAWKRAFGLWQKQRKDAATLTNVKPGTYDDFKVHLSDDMRTGIHLVPKDNGGNVLQIGEWNYCTLYTPDGTTSADAFTLHMLGGHEGAAGARTSVGIIQSYGDSRTTVDNSSPNVPSTMEDDPLLNMFDDGTHLDEVLEEVRNENDEPPYDADLYAGDGGNMPKPLVVQDTTIVDGRAVVGGFSAIAGLIEVEAKSTILNDTYSILVEVAPGNYRGIAAEVI